MKSEIICEGIIRTPLLPFNYTKRFDEGTIVTLLNKTILEGIKNSSPEFYQETLSFLANKIVDPKKKENFYCTLYKYLSRSATRSTPFGILGTVGYVNLGIENNNKQIEIDSRVSKKLRLDPRCFQLIIDHLNIKLKYILYYNLNNTIYSLGKEELRYFQRIRTSSDIYYELSKISKNLVIETLIEQFKVPLIYDDFRKIWLKEFHEEEIHDFFNEIINENLIISELEISTENENYLELLIDKIKNYSEKIEISNELNVLSELNSILKNEYLDLDEIYNKIKTSLESLKIEYNEKDLIHIDSYRETTSDSFIEKNSLKDLLNLKELLIKMFPVKKDTFEKFINDYKRRYEDRIMPLLKVLDPETGIGFNTNIDDDDLFLEMKGRSNSKNLELTNTEVLLLRQLNKLEDDNYVLEIKELDFNSFDTDINVESESMTFFISVLRDKKLLFNSVSGSSGINLMSRFAYLDKRIQDLCNSLATHEKSCCHENLLAEIRHIPELKSANLLFYNSKRDFQIDCHEFSNISFTNKISLTDILIKIDNQGYIELISQENGRRIIPKLSSSINYNRNAIAAYRFLSEIQYQNLTKSIQFHWGSLTSLFSRLPRIEYKNIIVFPAIWILNKEDINEFNRYVTQGIEFLILFKNRNIPDKFYISRDIYDDNKLFIDIQNELSLKVFIREIKKFNICIISEFLFELGSEICDENGATYVNEIMLPVVNQKNNFSKIISLKSTLLDSKELIYTPGSKWVSFKVYLGVKCVDLFIIEKLVSWTQNLTEQEIISKWFFVKYFDEDFHLKFRLQIKDTVDISIILSKFCFNIENLIDSGHVHNIVYDTYKREIERYQTDYIDLCESIFYYDSEAVSSFLQLDTSFEERFKFAIIGVDSYLENFNFQLDEKLLFTEYIFNSFFVEFGGDKKLLDSLNKIYRERRSNLETELGEYKLGINKKKSFVIILNRSHKIENDLTKDIIIELKEQKDIIFSLIHMFLNRTFEMNPRKNELIVYFCLFNYYKSEKFKTLSNLKHS